MIVQWPNKVLRMKCEDVLEDEFGSDDLLNFLDMLGSIIAENGAAGVSAPQVGVPKNIVILGKNVITLDSDHLFAILNPRIVGSKDTILTNEGCLSFPGLMHERERAKTVVVEFNDIDGASRIHTFEGYGAIVIQHEIDHLNGKIMVDDLSPVAKKMKLKKWIKEAEKEAFQESIKPIKEGVQL